MDLELINKRKKELENVKIVLKEKFIGIDDIIDKIVNSISLWYIIPEYQLRPLIINLWGVTGVGKTDLVRTLVKTLEFNDKFLEVQLDMKEDYNRNIQDYIEFANINTDEQCILLLDEMQRFRTIDETGKMIENKYFNDIWMLLSDGKFQNDNKRKNELINLFLDEMYYYELAENEKNKKAKNTQNTPNLNNSELDETPTYVEQDSSKMKYKTSYWSASRLKKLLKNNFTTEDIMMLNFDEKIELIKSALSDNTISEGKTYSKMLIFISGNLDEAYRMSGNVEDCEQDADIYNELSKRINIINIKDALTLKFKPEQIARFGNNHIIYPCLNRQNYYDIIKKYCNQILDNIYEKNNIKINLTNNIYDIIYKNGVYPTQGVRPVISSISNIIESNIPHFLFVALENNRNDITVDFEDSQLFCEIDGKKFYKKIILDIDNIKKNKSVDEKMLVLVHEIGHALIYAILFKTPPSQININAAGFSTGFVVNHASVDNKTFLKNKICVSLAGLASEECIFGEDFKSNGSVSDIFNATNIAGKYIRKYAMNGTLSNIMRANPDTSIEGFYSTDISDQEIEHLLKEQKTRVNELLKVNIKLFKALIKHGVEKGNMEIKDFLDICKEYDLALTVIDINDKIIYDYNDKLKDFLNS